MKGKKIKQLTRKAVDSACQTPEPSFDAFERKEQIDWETVANGAKAGSYKEGHRAWRKPALIAASIALVVGVGVGVPVGFSIKGASESHYGGNTDPCTLKRGTYTIAQDYGSSAPIGFTSKSSAVFTEGTTTQKKGSVTCQKSALGFSGTLTFADCDLSSANFTEAYRRNGNSAIYATMELNGAAYQISIISEYETSSPGFDLQITAVSSEYDFMVPFNFNQ